MGKRRFGSSLLNVTLVRTPTQDHADCLIAAKRLLADNKSHVRVESCYWTSLDVMRACQGSGSTGGVCTVITYVDTTGVHQMLVCINFVHLTSVRCYMETQTQLRCPCHCPRHLVSRVRPDQTIPGFSSTVSQVTVLFHLFSMPSQRIPVQRHA